MSAKEAYDVMGKTLVMSTIVNMSQTDDHYIFGIYTFNPNYMGRNGYDTINKETGKYEFMRYENYNHLMNEGKVEKIDMLAFA